MPATRRQFLRMGAVAGVSLGLGEWAAFLAISPASVREAEVTPDLVRFGPDIEPIVRLIEDTPREKCPAMMIEQLQKGLPYRNLSPQWRPHMVAAASYSFVGRDAPDTDLSKQVRDAIRTL